MFQRCSYLCRDNSQLHLEPTTTNRSRAVNSVALVFGSIVVVVVVGSIDKSSSARVLLVTSPIEIPFGQDDRLRSSTKSIARMETTSNLSQTTNIVERRARPIVSLTVSTCRSLVYVHSLIDVATKQRETLDFDERDPIVVSSMSSPMSTIAVRRRRDARVALVCSLTNDRRT
jgi:hypothetical protein